MTVSARTMATSLPRLPILEAVAAHDPTSTAVVHAPSGRRFTYGELLGDVGRARDRLREAREGKDLDGERVAFLVENSYDYIGEPNREGDVDPKACQILEIKIPYLLKSGVFFSPNHTYSFPAMLLPERI
jgi:acyl-CoA synthetase (AMP-forming)/AMP-acid ligase II